MNTKRKEPPTRAAREEGGGRSLPSRRRRNGGEEGPPSSGADRSSAREKERRYCRRNLRGRDDDSSRIRADGELVEGPAAWNVVVSYGVLLYKRRDDDGDDGGGGDDDARYEYLLGLIPQGNAWTVFKGMPADDGNETPEETAMREFEEETGLPFPYPTFQKTTTLFGWTANKKKLLEIYLVKAPSDFSVAAFDKEKVVKIDAGYMRGKPEIVDVRFLTRRQAVEGTTTRDRAAGGRVVKIYKSQMGILEHADVFLRSREATREAS